MSAAGANRRAFIAALGGAAAWPVVARARQPAMPIVGYLSSFSADANNKFTQAFQEGLSDVGFIEGRNVTIKYRWAEEGRYDELPMMATDLVDHRVAVIFASPIPAALAAKTATATIPIVFAVGSDPVETGLVVSLNRPGGNVTGATFLSVELGAKRLELLPPRHHRPRHRAAECSDKRTPSHSITLSARATRLSGIVTPSNLLVLRLISSSNFVGCSTGRSAGFAPLSILST